MLVDTENISEEVHKKLREALVSEEGTWWLEELDRRLFTVICMYWEQFFMGVSCFCTFYD